MRNEEIGSVSTHVNREGLKIRTGKKKRLAESKIAFLALF